MYYYIEYEGRVFLVEQEGILEFPSSKKEIPFEFKMLGDFIQVQNKEIQFCRPVLDKFPNTWMCKDEAASSEKCSLFVRQAINYSYCRPVSNAIVVNKAGHVLLVKNKRGLLEGKWSIPGGFIDWDEHPKKAIEREIFEETGYIAQAEQILCVHKNTFKEGSGYFMINVNYLCTITGGKSTVPNEEVSEMGFFPPKTAISMVAGVFSKKAIKAFIAYCAA